MGENADVAEPRTDDSRSPIARYRGFKLSG